MNDPMRSAALAFALLLVFSTAAALPAAADSTQTQPQKSSAAAVPDSAVRNALRPDLAVSLSPDAPGQWPMHFAVVNIGHAKSDDEYLRIGVFVVGEDPLTRKSCIPRYTGSDTLVKALAPNASTLVQTGGFAPGNVKSMPAPPNTPPPVIHDGTIVCTFQVGASLANVGKNDANKANDQVVRTLSFTMPVKP